MPSTGSTSSSRRTDESCGTSCWTPSSSRPASSASRPRAKALLALAALIAAGCADPPPPPEKRLRPVRHVVAAIDDGTNARTFAGAARAGVESRLSFRVNGTLDRVAVEVGDRVRRGQLLAAIDPTDYDLAVEQARASVAQGEAALRRAEADYERVRQLYENRNASKSELDAARAGAESARAQVDAATKGLEQSQQQRSYTVLRAPVDGDIALVEAEVNENVSAGQVLFLLTSGARPEVTIAVPEGLIGRVAQGASAQVSFDAIPGRVFPATVTEVGVAATGAAAFDVTLRLDDAAAEVRSGMAAEVRLDFGDGSGREIVLPSVAVGEDRDGNFVFVLEPQTDGTAIARRRAVVVGPMTPDGLRIVDGLTPGEHVATAGVRRLVDGMQVLLLDDGNAS